MTKPVVLVVMDGVGWTPKDKGNAVLHAYKPQLDELMTKSRTPQTTDRESSIFFGLPPTLIEGVLVGRKIENDIDKLNYIKNKLPDCYICNLDGKVIMGNK